MATRHEHRSVYTADNKDFKRKTKQVQSSSKKLSQSIMKLGGAFAAAFSLRKVISFFSSTLKFFDKQIQAEKRLESAVRANGEAVDSTMTEYKRWASELQRVSTVGDETTLDMLAVAQSMGVTGDAAKQAVKEAVSLAKAMGMNEKSAIRYTAALQDGNSTMLARYLPGLRQIESNAERTAKAHELLGNMFSQVTEEAKQGLGPIKQLSNAYGDMKEQIGELTASGGNLKGSMGNLKSKIVELTDAMDDINFVQNNKWIKENATLWDKLIIKVGRYTEVGRKLISNMADIRKGIEGENAELSRLKTKRYELNKELEKTADWDTASIINLKQKIKEISNLIKKEEKREETIENNIVSLDSLNETLKKQKDALNNTDVNNKALIATRVADIDATQKQIDALQAYIDKLREVKKPEYVEPPEKIKIGEVEDIDPAMASMDALKAKNEELAESFEESGVSINDTLNTIGMTVQSTTSAFSNLGNVIAKAAEDGEVSFAESMNIIQQTALTAISILGALAAAEIIAAEASKGLIGIATAIAGLAALAALWATYVQPKPVAMAEGAEVTGPTLALVGEASGISASNPEYVGTASQLQPVIGSGNKKTLTARISRGDLLFMLNEGKVHNERNY